MIVYKTKEEYLLGTAGDMKYVIQHVLVYLTTCGVRRMGTACAEMCIGARPDVLSVRLRCTYK